MSPISDDRARAIKRQRGKNIAVLVVLIGIAVLFYAISMVKFRVS